MDQVELLAYTTPAIIDTFEACEVLGAAEGLVCGLGSQMCA
jgi:hypothetical protein